MGPLADLVAAAPVPALGAALAGDAADPAACTLLVDAAAAFLEPHGGLDTVVYAAGMAPLGSVADTTAGAWHELLATNLVGAALVVARALPHLRRHAAGVATVVVLSSHSVGAPWPGLVPYAASKAGLNELAVGLRTEEPGVRTLRIAVGPTATSFADGWEAGAAGDYFTRWSAEGYLDDGVLEPATTAAAILAALDDAASPDDIMVKAGSRTAADEE
jgi:NAD(P)-dependent dehydrogenase (short-subunit alcohol dehydrogenase family)